MDIRNAKVEPTVEHGGTCHTYFMFPKESVREETMGSYLEYVAEFELAGGAHTLNRILMIRMSSITCFTGRRSFRSTTNNNSWTRVT